MCLAYAYWHKTLERINKKLCNFFWIDTQNKKHKIKRKKNNSNSHNYFYIPINLSFYYSLHFFAYVYYTLRCFLHLFYFINLIHANCLISNKLLKILYFICCYTLLLFFILFILFLKKFCSFSFCTAAAAKAQLFVLFDFFIVSLLCIFFTPHSLRATKNTTVTRKYINCIRSGINNKVK